MGYAHGKRWTDKMIEAEILQTTKWFDIDRMPSVSELKKNGFGGLAVAISRNGGFKAWASRLNLKMKESETGLGWKFEEYFCKYIERWLGLNCERMATRFPYDVLIDGLVKVDVKCSRLYMGKAGNFYSFNLETKNARCDIYACYCLTNNKEVEKMYIIPSVVLQGNTQLSVGQMTSKYDPYLFNYPIITQYHEFLKPMQAIN